MKGIKRDAFVNITDVICPITFVKAKVVIEELESRWVLETKTKLRRTHSKCAK